MNSSRSHHASSRHAPRQRYLYEALRGRILSGEWRPGDRLPTCREIEREYEISRVIVQRTFVQLKDDGFIMTRGRGGTVVNPDAPFLHRYGIVFPFYEGHYSMTQLYLALQNEAMSLQSPLHRFEFYHYGGAGNIGEIHRLSSDAREHRLAGVIFAGVTENYGQSPLMIESAIPRVAILNGPARHLIDVDYTSFVERAVDYLVAQRCQRIAMVFYRTNFSFWQQDLERLYSAHGLALSRRWIQSLAEINGGWAINQLEPLFDATQPERPDSLIILDDNVVPEVTDAIARLGLRVPDDLLVIGHANFPWETPSHVPIIRMGFDVRRMLLNAVESIDRQRAGDTMAGSITLPAIFKDQMIAQYA